MIIWLASYPKSGNTWLRMFLKSYFQKPGTKFVLNKDVLDNFRSHGFPDLEILKHLKINFKKFEEIARNWETMQDYINLNNKTNFLKTHNSMCTVGPYKFTTHKNTKGGIYLIRDPRDVLISYSSHLGKSYEDTFKIMLVAYWIHVGTMFESVWEDHLGIILGQFLDHFRIILK